MSDIDEFLRGLASEGRQDSEGAFTVDLALANFARIVGVRNGRLAFDLPAAQVSEAQLQALYAHADGRAADLPTLHNRLAQHDTASAAPAPIQVNACR